MPSAPPSLVLIGMMGAGKSSVGRCLQRRTGLPLFDMDELIVSQAGMAIAEIFTRDGEKRFRDLESEVLRRFVPQEPAILVTGGGVVLREENVSLLKRVGTVIWLDADEETLFARATRRPGRPLLNNENPRARFSDILRARGPLYASASDLRIDTTLATHDEVADLILQKIETRTTTAQ